MTVYTKPIAVGADWSARPISGAKIKNTRVSYSWFRNTNNVPTTVAAEDNLSFVLRYANFSGQRLSFMAKAEHDDFVANDITPYLIYQKTTTDPNGGANAGNAFGLEAVAYARSIGYRKGAPIFFTADAPIGSYNLTTAVAFFRAATDVVRAAEFKGGVYGFRDVVYACQDAGVGDVYWLCGAESGMRAGIHLYQFNNDRIYPDGVEADLVKQFIAIEEGVDDVSADDVWYKKVVGPDGNEQSYNFNDATYWTNKFVNDLKFIDQPKLQAQLDALIVLLSKATTNPGIDPAMVRKTFDDALKGVLDGFLLQLAVVVENEVGEGQKDLARKIMEEMSQRLTA